MRTCPRRVTPLLVMLKVLPLAPPFSTTGTGEDNASGCTEALGKLRARLRSSNGLVQRFPAWSQVGEQSAAAAAAEGDATAETAGETRDAARQVLGDAWSSARDGAARAPDYGAEQGAQARDATRFTSERPCNPVTGAFDGDGR